jgi:hypothetical protein
MYDIAKEIPDVRPFMKIWRQRLQECLSQQNSRVVRFLLTDEPPDFPQRCQDIIEKFSNPKWNFASSIKGLTFSVQEETPTPSIQTWIDREIGMQPMTLLEKTRTVVQLYTETATSIGAAEMRLQEKLTRLESIADTVHSLMNIDPTADLERLIEPTQTYLKSVFDKIRIDEEYTELIELYSRFSLLRGIVILKEFQKNNPTCTICMTKEITHALTPCGHTFCGDCCDQQMTSCFICRNQIRDRLRIYYS